MLPKPPQQVALKRIPDVLGSLEYAKRVLREVCILRRMDHPGIIALKDVFLRPASTGGCLCCVCCACLWCGVCWLWFVMRRMDHPGIITLKDVFLRPASTGERTKCSRRSTGSSDLRARHRALPFSMVDRS